MRSLIASLISLLILCALIVKSLDRLKLRSKKIRAQRQMQKMIDVMKGKSVYVLKDPQGLILSR